MAFDPLKVSEKRLLYGQRWIKKGATAMQVIINRNLCGHHPAACEKCFGEFLLKGAVPDRGCILQVIEDGAPEVNAVITSGKYTATLQVTDANREEIIYDGYIKFVDLPFEAFEIQPPTGSEIRRILSEHNESSTAP
jgi:hypothetical protein